MDRSPQPISVAAARLLPLPPDGRKSADAFRDQNIDIRFATRPTRGPQTPHTRDEVYVVASGSGRYQVDGNETAFGPGDLLFAAAHAPHGFVDYTDDLAIWIVFYGPEK
jgi:mannose-6-phosphate isomerase-like protein (cupin superfamily)